jgi:hypothetical protein
MPKGISGGFFSQPDLSLGAAIDIVQMQVNEFVICSRCAGCPPVDPDHTEHPRELILA